MSAATSLVVAPRRLLRRRESRLNSMSCSMGPLPRAEYMPVRDLVRCKRVLENELGDLRQVRDGLCVERVALRLRVRELEDAEGVARSASQEILEENVRLKARVADLEVASRVFAVEARSAHSCGDSCCLIWRSLMWNSKLRRRTWPRTLILTLLPLLCLSLGGANQGCLFLTSSIA